MLYLYLLSASFLQLSPALRNRFTEIWCPWDNSDVDLKAIVEHNVCQGIHLSPGAVGTSGFGDAIVAFLKWFLGTGFRKL